MAKLNIDSQSELVIELNEVIGESIAILGIKGSGKTNTAAVVIEELLTNGLPLTIVDIEGEYWGLKEKFEIYVVGKSANVDVPVGVTHAAYYAEYSIKHGVSLILDLSEFEQQETHEFLLEYFKALWQAAFKIRRPYQIVLEEAHEFVPQTVRTPLKEILTRIALRGRKRGLGIISVSQRSAKVEKDILTQAGLVFLHRVVHPIDIRVYQDVLPLPPREVELGISSLRQGDAFVLVDSAVHRIHVRQRYTFHAGSTPQMDETRRPRLRSGNRELLLELKRLAQGTAPQRNPIGEQGRLRQLENQLAEKDEQIAVLKRRIETLEAQIDLLGKLQVSVADQPYTRQMLNRNYLTTDSVATSNRPTTGGSPQTELSKAEASLEGSSEQLAQEKRFAYLVSDVRKLPSFHRNMLSFLTERSDMAFTVAELARWLDIRESTIVNRPPLELIKMRLIKRAGTRGQFTYSSSAKEQLEVMFPLLTSAVTVDRLLHSIRR